MDLAELTLEKMKPFVGTTFEVTTPENGTITMKLDDALPFELQERRRSRKAGPTPKRAPFCVYFIGDPTILLPQGMYSFQSEGLTLENLFIVPLGRDEEATEYEAIFT